VGDSSHCAGSEDDFCVGACDCFVGTMAGALANGKWEYLATDRNVGGSSPERFRPAAVTVSGTQAFTSLSVGHGTITEYWTARTDSFKKFCGWQCASRNSDGDCNTSIHSETGCSPGLNGKLDKTAFTNALATVAAAETPETSELGSLDATPVLAAIATLPGVSEEERDQLALAVEDSQDPVGRLVPMLEGWPRDRQLAFLRHIEGLPLGKAEAAVSSELVIGLDAEGRREAARALLDGLRTALESEPGAAATPPAGDASEPQAGCLVAPSATSIAGPWLLFALAVLVLVGLRRRRAR
jgi:MYXO-CTERM domain-containing protein